MGQGVLAEGGHVTHAMKKRCPFFYIIDPIMCDRASSKPLALSEVLDWENNNADAEQMMEDNSYDDSMYDPDTDAGGDSDNDAGVNPLLITGMTIGGEVGTDSVIGTTETIYSNAASVSGSLKTPKLSNNNNKTKRLLSVIAKASSQKKKKFDPFSITSQLNSEVQ
jgi:hypothetical protein